MVYNYFFLNNQNIQLKMQHLQEKSKENLYSLQNTLVPYSPMYKKNKRDSTLEEQ